MMRTLTWMAGLAAACLVGIASVGADDKVKAIDPQGKPAFEAGSGDLYAVWHDKHGWHLRTTTAKKQHRFRGTIKVDGGSIVKIHSHHLEKEGRLEDHWKVSKDKKEVVFDFETDKGIDGIGFHLSKEAKHVRFNLHIDGKHQAGKILIGHGKHHPQHDPFTLPAHPHAKK